LSLCNGFRIFKIGLRDMGVGRGEGGGRGRGPPGFSYMAQM